MAPSDKQVGVLHGCARLLLREPFDQYGSKHRAIRQHAPMAHDDLRRVITMATSVIDDVPERPRAGSPRAREVTSLRSTAGGGGLTRASLSHQLNSEMQVMAAHLLLLTGGIADTLEAATRRGNEINGPALAHVVRPSLELAGQIAWLLTDEIDGAARAKRYLVWRLADLRAQRLLLRDFRSGHDVTDAAYAELDEVEQELLGLATSAKWISRATKVRGDDIEAAALLGEDGKPERMPGLGELVRGVSSTPATYGLLSVTSHSQRFGVFQGLDLEAGNDGDTRSARLSGFPLATNVLIGLAILAVNIPVRLLGGWNGMTVSSFHAACNTVMRRAGIQ